VGRYGSVDTLMSFALPVPKVMTNTEATIFILAGLKAVIRSSCTPEVQEEENRKEENAGKPV